jgi:hypothetical protein
VIVPASAQSSIVATPLVAAIVPASGGSGIAP